MPNLEFVIAAIVGETQQIGIGRNLNEALQQLFPGEDFSDVVGVALGDVNGEGVADGDGVVDRPATPAPDDTSDPDDTLDVDDPSVPGDELPDNLVDLLTELDRQFRLSQEALAADPPQRSAWAAAQDRIDELLAQFRELADGG